MATIHIIVTFIAIRWNVDYLLNFIYLIMINIFDDKLQDNKILIYIMFLYFKLSVQLSSDLTVFLWSC